MDEPVDPQPQAANDDAHHIEPSDEAALAEDAARVARAAEEVGVEVPDGFFLTGVDENGNHTAFMPGNSTALRNSAAILHRLDGGSVDDVLARMLQEPEAEPGPRPEWWPPDDWKDKEAMDAWLAERAKHPEWPDVYNGIGDWLPMLLNGAGVTALAAAAASHMNLRARIGFAKWLIKKAEAQGLHPDPVAVLRAFERAAPEPTLEPGALPTGQESTERPPDDGDLPER